MGKDLSIVGMVVVMLAACGGAPPPFFVHYDTGVDVPKGPQEYMTVGEALHVLENDSSAHLLVIGHADARGSDEVNRQLSFRRARGIKALLVERNIEPSRVVVGARGASEPVASDATSEGRARNRRTELFFFYPSEGDAAAVYHERFHIRIEVADE